MKILLRIDASIRRRGSFSRTLGDAFVGEWKHRHPQGDVLMRDITVGGTATRSFTDDWQTTYQHAISQLLNN